MTKSKKPHAVPCKVGGCGVMLERLRLAIENAECNLGDAPADVQSRFAYLSLALKEAGSQYFQLIKALNRHGIDLDMSDE